MTLYWSLLRLMYCTTVTEIISPVFSVYIKLQVQWKVAPQNPSEPIYVVLCLNDSIIKTHFADI